MSTTLCRLPLLLITLLASLVLPCAASQTVDDFVIYNRATGKAIQREDFAGKILVLDFIAHWCEPCRESSPQIQKMGEAFRKAGGNKHGVEVVVLAVNVESKDPELTDKFISDVGFDLVADDFERVGGKGVYSQVRSGDLPHFTIINGLSDNNYQQWAVVANAQGFYPLATYKNIINQIKGPGTAGAHIQVEANTIIRYTPQKYHLFSGNSLNFLAIRPGKSLWSRKLAISNAGSKPLDLQRIWISGPDRKDFKFRTVGASQLAPGKDIEVVLKFKPTRKGSSKARFVVKSNDPENPRYFIKLDGLTERN